MKCVGPPRMRAAPTCRTSSMPCATPPNPPTARSSLGSASPSHAGWQWKATAWAAPFAGTPRRKRSSKTVDFEYTPEQIQLRKAVREFAEAEIAPHVMEWDEAQTFPLDVIRKLGELGYMGSIFPEELGGAGLGYIEYSIIIEELSRVDGSVGIIVAAHTSLCSNHIYKMGSDEQNKKYLSKLT